MCKKNLVVKVLDEYNRDTLNRQWLPQLTIVKQNGPELFANWPETYV